MGAGTSKPSCVLDVYRLLAGVCVRVGVVGAEETRTDKYTVKKRESIRVADKMDDGPFYNSTWITVDISPSQPTYYVT